MDETGWRQRLHDAWLTLTIEKKIGVFTGVVFLVIFISAVFDFWVVQFSLWDFRGILEDNARSSEYMEAMELESKCFAVYVKNPSEAARLELTQACSRTEWAISRLPFDYEQMNPYRYAKTWSIKNSYEIYRKERDLVLDMGEETGEYIGRLYRVYDMQSFLEDYARALMRYTLEDENALYERKLPLIRLIPLILLLLCGVLLWGMVSLARLMYKSIISPIVELVAVSKKIAANDFFVEDVRVENKDEMGELVKAFNKMKYATGQYILAFEEKRRMLDLLHKEELERLEVEKRLETTNLELLKSQLDPHFLFNTLNVIAGMANLEDAQTTEKMIKALSSLFRYNLQTPEAEATLAQELRIVKDYMYLQKMRFGDRISYTIECELDPESFLVPTFSFQPLVENAIIHGLSKKEEGGNVAIRARQEGENLVITIADTGVGMDEETLIRLNRAFQEESTARIGIGLGNIYKRIRGMYRSGGMEVSSREGEGTVVKLTIPQYERGEACDETGINCG